MTAKVLGKTDGVKGPIYVGLPNGLATLDSGGKVPAAQLPALAVNQVFTVASQAAMLALAANVGDVAVRTDLAPHETFMLAASPATTLGNWIQVTADSGAAAIAEAYTDSAMATERARADSAYVAQVPTVGSYTYDGSGRVTADPDGNTYTYNTDDTVHTITKGGVTRTATYGANGIASWA